MVNPRRRGVDAGGMRRAVEQQGQPPQAGGRPCDSVRHDARARVASFAIARGLAQPRDCKGQPEAPIVLFAISAVDGGMIDLDNGGMIDLVQAIKP